MTIALTIAFIIMAFCLPALFCAGFYYGFNTAERVFTTQSVSAEDIPGKSVLDAVKIAAPTHFVPKKKESDEERLQRITAENIENYGTAITQKEVI